MKNSSIAEFQAKQDLFNELAGKADKYSYDDLFNQYLLIVEEGYHEGKEAFEQDNAVKLLDSFVDTLFVVLGALQKMKNAGFDVEGAMQQVADDNLSKFPIDTFEMLSTVEKYNNEGIQVSVRRIGEFYVIQNKATGKILKPIGFKQTDLSKYCPYKTITGIGDERNSDE
jgi:hypothetical protein